MNHKRLSTLFLLFILFILSCDNDDRPVICRPIGISVLGDSTIFEYNSTDKVQRVIHYIIGSDHIQQDKLEYDNEGRLVRVSFFGSGSPQAFQTHELIYNGKPYPEKLHSWGTDTSTSPFVTTFTHDAKGRLVRREYFSGVDAVSLIFEYDDKDNVVRFFYKYNTNLEVLGYENLSFDDRERFYSDVAELEKLYIYVNRIEPGKNNVLISKMYASGPFDIFSKPADQMNNVTYYENGLVVNSVFASGSLYWEYNDARYECR